MRSHANLSPVERDSVLHVVHVLESMLRDRSSHRLMMHVTAIKQALERSERRSAGDQRFLARNFEEQTA
jgi:hypothetical protein